MGKVKIDVFVKYWRGNCPLPPTYPFSGPLGDIQLQHSTYSLSNHLGCRAALEGLGKIRVLVLDF